ncbi:hypothetical protein S40288_02234 [Stachybotrys chartarum IBT 40288]|nr:hypothetical protein S40288_02234 [Stachybotrys chartarum IBT 40288]
MRERITFVHPVGAWADDDELPEVRESGLLGPHLDTAREDRLTIPIDELPSDLKTIFQDFQQVSIRWASPLAYDTVEPFSSRLSPGLHVIYTLSDKTQEHTQSKTLKLAALSPLMAQKISVASSTHHRVEVGIFTKGEPAQLRPHDLGVSGLLTVLGESETPSPTIFSFPARHRLSAASFSSQFIAPTGLHPTLQLKISSNKPPVENGECRPYTYLTLPKTFFADRYQLADKLFLASKNLTTLRYSSLPVDLEAPAYTTDTWGSSVLLELAPPETTSSEAWTAEVPLHLRYLAPSTSGYVEVKLPYPVLFWACSADNAIDFANNPFDRVHLGYDTLFDPNTVFWHATPSPGVGSRLMNQIDVPVLKGETASWVGFGTALAVALGFAWVLWKIMAAYSKNGQGGSLRTQDSKKTQ